MDITSVFIGVAVFIISALVIYFISAFSMREKTFEEVMEEQRSRQDAEREKTKAEKKAEKDSKKKFKKGKSDKGKDKVVEPEIKAEPKMVNLDIDPEVIEPAQNQGLGDGVRQRGKKEKAPKSILHNKDEKVKVAAKTVEAIHKPIVPKDELALKKAHVEEKMVVEKMTKTKAAPQQKEVKAKETKQKIQVETKENVPPMQKKEASKGTPVKNNKSKTADDVQPNGSKQLISSLKTTKFSDEDVQTVIEVMLNKQGGSPSVDSWNMKSQKGDPIPLMKKQLEEKEKVLQEEQNLAMSANNKVKELRNELGAERTKYTALEKRYQEQLSHKQAEMDALTQRVQHTHEQHMIESSQLQAKLRQTTESGGGDQAKAQKTATENKILQDTLSIKAKEMANLNAKIKSMEKGVNDSSSKIQAAETARKNSEAKVATLEDKIHKLDGAQKDVDSVVNKRVEEVATQLRKSEGKNDSLSSDLQKATSAVNTAQTEVTTLKAKLEELQTSLSRDSSKDSGNKLQESERKRSDLEGNVTNLEKQLVDLSKRLNESEASNNTLKQENKLVNERLQAVPATNGDVHEQSGMSLEEHEKKMSGLQGQVDLKSSEVTDLTTQLTQQKAKNNELREKNWKAMEALEKAEKNSSDKVDKALKSARELSSSGSSEVESYDKVVFQRLFPEVSVSDKLPHKDWVGTFEMQATKQIKSTSAQFESENKRLKEEVTQYSSIVSETESKLKQLEKSIEAEEKNWTAKLKAAESSSSSSTSTKGSDSQKRVLELEGQLSAQETQINQYKNILAVTDNSLRGLESKVETEEKTWTEKLSSSQGQLVKSQEELKDLKNKLGVSSDSQEMQSKVATLEVQLKESQQTIVVLTTEKQTLEKRIVVTGGAGGSDKEVGDLRGQNEIERKKNKDLCLNVVKLNGIIKTGQDALSQEQDLVKKLQEQLDYKSIKSGVSEMDEIEQLRSKLSEKQKLLEREMTVNKQLSERLAQLGVLANATPENGTSV